MTKSHMRKIARRRLILFNVGVVSQALMAWTAYDLATSLGAELSNARTAAV